ncbi:MAG: hypothetical protein QM808_17800 [Steroidobacteraceae bacterium]
MSRLRRFIANPFFAASLALVAPLAGAWVAFRKPYIVDAIKQWSHFSGGPLKNHGDFWIFAGAFAVFLVGFSWHKKAESSIAVEKQDQLTRGIKKLDEKIAELDQEIELVTTLRLVRFAQTYNETLRTIFPLILYANPDSQKPEVIVNLARAIVSKIVVLAGEMDGSPVGVKYSASVFLYRTKEQLETLPPQKLNDLRAQIEFTQNIACEMRYLSGVLRRCPEASFSQSPQPPEENPKERLTLPVHSHVYADSDSKQFRVLPGAPQAIAWDDSVILRSHSEVETWCRDLADYTDAAQKEVIDFFKMRPIKSFMAIPLSDDEKRKIGVLVIERSTEGLFQSRGQFETVPALLTPFLTPLTDILGVYMEKVPIDQ